MDQDKLSRSLEMYWTISWFIMDACWMFGLPLVATAPALVAIVCAEYIITRLTKGVDTIVAFANASWLVMNVSWMLQDVWTDGMMYSFLSYMKGTFLVAGVLCIVVVGWKNRDLLWYFRRFKIGRR